MARSESAFETDDFAGAVVSAFKLIDKSWDAFKLNWVTFVVLLLIPMALAWAAIFGIVAALAGDSLFTTLLAVLIGAVIVVVACLLAPMLVATQLASARGKKLDVQGAFDKAKAVIFPFIGLAIVAAVAIAVGLVLLIVPGVLIAFFLTFAAYVLVDKKVGIVAAIKGSFELVKENWQWVIALILVNIVISAVAYVPIVGWIASVVLTIAYLCLPAIIYNKISK